MRVFVTGASGWVGSAVVPELVAAGHQVTGLARSETSAAAVTAAGATPVRGTVEDLDVLRDAAAASDAVIHLAFPVDLAYAGRMDDAVASDVVTIRTLGEALPTGGAIATATGTAGLARNGVPATERDRPAADALIASRQPSDDAALALNTLFFADEIRDPGEILGEAGSSAAPSDKELQMATTIIESMSGEWTPEEYQDTYTARVEKLVEEKAQGRAPEAAEAPPQPTDVIDLT